MRMTAAELIEILQDVDPDTEIRFAAQPSYPMEYSVRTETAFETSIPGVLYLAEASQIGYLPGSAAEQLGW